MVITLRETNLPQRLLAMFQFYCTCMEENKLGTAMDCIEEVAAMSLQVVLRECRQLGTDLTITQGEQFLQSRILPHQNRGKLKNRTDEISALIQRAVDQSSTPGIRGEAEKRAIAGWILLLPVPKYRSNRMRMRGGSCIRRSQPHQDKNNPCKPYRRITISD